MTGLFAGIYYQHDEEYLNPQTNGSWSGLWVFNEVDNGTFDEMPVSMSYLRGEVWMKTFDEMLELISHSLDEVTLLEVLEINSEDIVVAFSDRIRNQLHKFNGLEEEVDEQHKRSNTRRMGQG